MIYWKFDKNKGLLDGRKLFLVCRGSFDRLEMSEYINSLDPVRFSGFTPNPKMEEVMDGVKAFKDSGCDTILAVGGGSPIDVAKCIKHYSGSDAPVIAVPTTSGTGSESTHFAVVYENGKKLSVAAPELLPEIVILEPETLRNVPEYTRKATMLDALCHAIESHWAKKATPESRELAEKAIALIMKYKDAYLANEDEGNAGMMEAANLAGQAINITTTTAAHAMCYKITSMYGFQHGHAAAICLPEVWKYIDDNAGITREEFIALIHDLGMEYPVSATPEEDIEKLAASVNLQRLSNSPAAFDHDQLAAMYRKIIKPAKPLGVRRNVLLNPGPATTTDTVKMAQIVPDICPREKEFGQIMKDIQADLVRIVHGDPDKYTSVLFCGSGTINIDVCINSLLPEGGKVLVLNNGSYSARAAEICEFYGLPYMQLQFPLDSQPDLALIEKTLQENPDIALVHIAHHETGTGLLNPIREIGEIVHRYDAIFTVDSTSTYAMRPIDIEKDNVDFCMASAQKGLMSMTGLSFVVGNRSIIEASKDYPKRSYYCNLWLQYDYFERTGQMHFTPPVQTIYATKQALREYWAEGEEGKWARHTRVFDAITEGLDRLGFRQFIRKDLRSGLVAAAQYPDDPAWSFEKVHDYCYERGFTIYPGKVDGQGMFRLCALGAIDAPDISDFFKVFEDALAECGVAVPVKYDA